MNSDNKFIKNLPRYIPVILKELWTLFKLSWPMLLTSLGFVNINIISFIFAGHLGNASLNLAATFLAQTIIDLTGLYPIYGLSSALDTLASQAFGAGQDKYLGVLLQRAVLYIAFILLPIAIIWLNGENIMILFNQPPEIVALSGKYLLAYLPVLPAYAILFPVMKILQTQDIVIPSAIISIIGNVIEIALCYLLAFTANLGLYGLALGPVIATYLIAICHCFYIRFSSVWNIIWGGLDFRALEKWGQFTYYGTPVLISILSELIPILLGGYIIAFVVNNANVQISIYTCISNLDQLIFMVIFSVQMVASIRIGNLVGEGNSQKAKGIAFLVVCTILLICLTQSSILLAGRNIWGKIFSSDHRVTEGLASIVYILAIYHPFDGLVAVFQGILRGAGKQDLGMILSCGFGLVAFPIAITLTIQLRMGTTGYLLGIMTGFIMRVLMCGILIICCIRWNKIERVDNNYEETTPLTRPLENETSYYTISNVNRPFSTYNEQLNSIGILLNSTKYRSSKNFKTSIKMRLNSMKWKLALLIVFTLFLIVTVYCKWSDQKLDLYLYSYIQAPVDFCCFRFVPLNNTYPTNQTSSNFTFLL